MPGTKRGRQSLDSDGTGKRARVLDGNVAAFETSNRVPELTHLDDLGFELEEKAPVKLVNSGLRCYAAWAAFEGKASDLSVNLESRSEDVRAFVRVNGVGRRSRARLWMAWSGARAKMLGSAVTYADFLRDALLLVEDGTAAEDEKKKTQRALRQHLHQIELDLERTFPNHPEFRTGGDDDDDDTAPQTGRDETENSTDTTTSETKTEYGQKLQPLRRVLSALALAVPEIGYTQGMNFVCGFCLLVLESSGLGLDNDNSSCQHQLEEQCFWLMRSILTDVLPNYFAPGLANLRHDLDLLDSEFLELAPDAHASLELHGFSVKCFCPRWLLCVMVGTAPTEVTLRVWDALLVDAPVSGSAFSFREKKNEAVASDTKKEVTSAKDASRSPLCNTRLHKPMPSLRFRPSDVLRRCALTLLTSPGRTKLITVAPGAGEAVDAIRGAGKTVLDVSSFLRRVRDLAPGSKPRTGSGGVPARALRTILGTVVGVGRVVRGNSGASAATKQTKDSTPPDANTKSSKSSANAQHELSNSFAPRPVLTPFGNLLSVIRSGSERFGGEQVKPRVLWKVQEGDGGEASSGRDAGTGTGTKKRKKHGLENENGIELDGGSCATPSRRRVIGVSAMATWASPTGRSPLQAGYGYDWPRDVARSPLARMR